jgi:hypothetical protein
MAVTSRIWSAFVVVLTFLVLLGHVCELPLSAMASAHADAGDHGPSGHHHGDDSEVACDAVLGVQRATPDHSNLSLDLNAYSHPVVPAAALHVVSATVPHSDTVALRPPLFLLHAALLI